MELQISDMTCGGCAAAVTRAVTNLDSGAKVDIDVATRNVKIDSGAAPGSLLAAIEAAGFHPVEKTGA